MLQAVTDALGSVLSWIGTVIKAIVTVGGEGVEAGALNGLLPLFAVGIAISVFLFGIRAIKSVIWGA